MTLIGLGLGLYRYLYPPPVFPLSVHSYSDGGYGFYALGERFELRIAAERISASPGWDRRRPNPPVSAGDALIRAERVRLQWIKDKQLRENPGGNWGLESLELVATSDNEWYWLAKFAHHIEGTGPPHEFYVAVLMDGSVIEPTKVRVAQDDQ